MTPAAVRVPASVVPTITGELSGKQLFAYMELFADSPAAFEGTTVAIEVAPAGGTHVVERGTASLQPVQEGQPVRAVSGSVSMALLTPGGVRSKGRRHRGRPNGRP